jgi:uncharacterized protein
MQRFVRRFAVRFVPVAAAAIVSHPLDAQASPAQPPQPPPFIAASAVGDTRVVPDRAMLNVAVESQGESAAKVGADNAAKQTRVIDAVKATGVPAAQIRTSGYNVSPEYVHEKGKPRITGYRAHNNVQVEVRDIASVGKVIDAALAAGANNIGSVGLFKANTDTARKEALQKAVTKARTEAEAAATAAGGSLGTLLELTIEPYGLPQPLMSRVMATSAVSGYSPSPTPIETGELVVQAVVRVRWQFVPGQR